MNWRSEAAAEEVSSPRKSQLDFNLRTRETLIITPTVENNRKEVQDHERRITSSVELVACRKHNILENAEF